MADEPTDPAEIPMAPESMTWEEAVRVKIQAWIAGGGAIADLVRQEVTA